MIKLSDLLSESVSIGTLDDVLGRYREHTNWTDWYIAGGCYTFADALYQYVGKKGKFVAVGEVGTGVMAHTVIHYKGYYCDYNGCRSKNDILYDITLNDKPEWFQVSRGDVTSEHNYNKREVMKIVNTLKDLE